VSLFCYEATAHELRLSIFIVSSSPIGQFTRSPEGAGIMACLPEGLEKQGFARVALDHETHWVSG
jgi:hypothetical protein